MRDLYDFEDDKPPLGQGSYGIVLKATHKQTGQHFACKILYVNRAATNSAKEITKLHSEVSIMRELDHPHIVRLREVFYARCVFVCAWVLDGAQQAGKGGWLSWPCHRSFSLSRSN